MNLVVKETLQALESNGRLTPREVLAAAESQNSPLHSMFEWDDSVAARKFRMDQARELIRTVKVSITREIHRIDAVVYVRDPTVKPREQGYVSLSQASTEEDTAKLIIHNEFKRANAAMKRASDVADVLGMKEQVAHVISQIYELSDSLVQ